MKTKIHKHHAIHILSALSLFILTLAATGHIFSTAADSVADLKLNNVQPPNAPPRLKRAAPATEKNAVLELSQIKKDSQNITLRVSIDPNGTPVNLVSAIISYPKDLVRPVAIKSENSDFYILLDETVDEQQKLIFVNYIIPQGINKKSVVADLIFYPRKSGLAAFSFSDKSVVLANDGYGTNVLRNSKGVTLNIVSK